MAEEMLVVVPGPVVGRRLRSWHRLQLPLAGVGRYDRWLYPVSGNVVRTSCCVADRKLTPLLGGAALEATDRAGHISSAAAQVGGDVDPAADRQVRAKARPVDAAEGKR